MTTTTTTPALTDADLTTKIDALTADIVRLNAAWKPYAKAGGVLTFDGHPMSLKAPSDAGDAFIRRQQIGLEIDQAEIDRATLGAEAGRRRLARLEAKDMSDLTTRRAAAAERVATAQAALREAQAAAYAIQLKLDGHTLDVTQARQGIAHQDDAVRRWTDERRKDQERLDAVGKRPRRLPGQDFNDGD